MATLKRALAAAEAGEVDEVLVIMRHPGADEWSNLSTCTQSFASWVGYLEITKADWIAKYKYNRDRSGK